MQDATHLPVLVTAFKRPDATRLVLDAIREVKPPRVYFAVDGPRPGDESEARQVRQVRELALSSFDWNCEVTTFFRDENRGCARGVSEAVTFFFEHEEAGVILEDDCVPEPDFFRFCADLLDRYRDDPRVMHLSGNSRVQVDDRESSYFFSRYPQVWGWATWREAWACFEFSPGQLERQLNLALSQFEDEAERIYWRKIMRRTFEGKIDSWAYRWAFSIWMAGGVSAYPTRNMVRNIGFGSDSTHTGRLSSSRWTMPPTVPLGAIRHPEPAALREDLDRIIFDRAYAKPPLPIRAGRAALQAARRRVGR